MKALSIEAALLAVVLTLGGCAPKAVTVSFPLATGREWTYSGSYRAAQQVARAVRINAYDHVMRVGAIEKIGGDEYFVTRLLIAQGAFGTLPLRWDGGNLYHPQGDGREVVLKGTLTPGDGWRFTFEGRTLDMSVGRAEEKTVPLGTYQAVRLDFAVKDEGCGKLWVADGVGIVALEYDAASNGRTTRLELGLSALKTGAEK